MSGGREHLRLRPGSGRRQRCGLRQPERHHPNGRGRPVRHRRVHRGCDGDDRSGHRHHRRRWPDPLPGHGGDRLRPGRPDHAPGGPRSSRRPRDREDLRAAGGGRATGSGRGRAASRGTASGGPAGGSGSARGVGRGRASRRGAGCGEPAGRERRAAAGDRYGGRGRERRWRQLGRDHRPHRDRDRRRRVRRVQEVSPTAQRHYRCAVPGGFVERVLSVGVPPPRPSTPRSVSSAPRS